MSRRHAGIAALDRWGLAINGFRCVDVRQLRRRLALDVAVAHFVRAVVDQYRPALVLIAHAGGESSPDPMTLITARRACRFFKVPVAERRVRDAEELFGGCSTGHRRALTHRLCDGFFPELRGYITHDYERSRYYRHAWQALALALRELVERHPRAAFALARRDVGNLGPSIARAESLHHPTYDPTKPYVAHPGPGTTQTSDRDLAVARPAHPDVPGASRDAVFEPSLATADADR